MVQQIPYYMEPTQVRFWDTGEQKFYGGIAYQDYIICGHCGKICQISEIIREAYEYSHLDSDSAIVELAWVSLSDHIQKGF